MNVYAILNIEPGEYDLCAVCSTRAIAEETLTSIQKNNIASRFIVVEIEVDRVANAFRDGLLFWHVSKTGAFLADPSETPSMRVFAAQNAEDAKAKYLAAKDTTNE